MTLEGVVQKMHFFSAFPKCHFPLYKHTYLTVVKHALCFEIKQVNKTDFSINKCKLKVETGFNKCFFLFKAHIIFLRSVFRKFTCLVLL